MGLASTIIQDADVNNTYRVISRPNLERRRRGLCSKPIGCTFSEALRPEFFARMPHSSHVLSQPRTWHIFTPRGILSTLIEAMVSTNRLHVTPLSPEDGYLAFRKRGIVHFYWAPRIIIIFRFTVLT